MKNYTSTVPADRSIARIEQALVRAKATQISKEYVGFTVAAVTFTIVDPESNQPVAIRLPGNVESVRQILARKMPRSNPKNVAEQATRTAWKLLVDWVEVQLSLIELKQIEPLQAFLPYAWDGKETLYARLRSGGFKALTYSGGETELQER